MSKTYVSIAAVAAVSAALVVLSNKLSELKVPDPEGTRESSSVGMYGIGEDATPTALGQVFKVPSRHSVMTNAGFLVRYPVFDRMPSSSPGVSRQMRIKLRISPWDGRKIAGAQVFESAAVELSKFERVTWFKYEWVYFSIPNLRLAPGNTYLAWITGVDLANESYDSLGIVHMGATRANQNSEWRFDYPEGHLVVWDKDTTDGSLSKMSAEPWKPEEPPRADLKHRASLHFRMTFRSRLPFLLCLRSAWC